MNVDILMICEGTYPYIRGGVSEWIHTIISNLRDFRFGIIFLGGNKQQYKEYAYDIPENVEVVEEFFLFEKLQKPNPEKVDISERSYKTLETLHKWFKEKKVFPWEAKKLDFYFESLTEKQFLYSYKSWQYIEEKYLENCPDHSFTEYFWNVRNMHAPIWTVAKAAKTKIKPKVIHSPSTGYAGFLGALMKYDRELPFIIHEHGIYTKERKIDLMNVEWLKDKRPFLLKDIAYIDYFKQMWINFFIALGKFEYEAADKIFSLFEDARNAQIMYGADPSKTDIIPNGIEIKKFLPIRKEKPPEKNIVALIGRVVPIKDIKTFIKAIKIVSYYIPDVEGWIVGNEDEDPEYAKECRELVRALDVEDNIKFLGYKNVEDVLPDVKLTTLTSISEGMPLVVLESFAAGIPVVTTDVGACRQLIYGGINQEDINLGKAGEIAPIGNPEAIAKLYVSFLTDENLWKKSSEVATLRVERFYTLEKLINKYKQIFQGYIDGRDRVRAKKDS